MKRPVLALLFGLLLVTPPVRADDEKEKCVAAAHEAQVLRDDGRLKDARTALVTCSAEACPLVVRKDCAKWLDELDAREASVVFSARDAAGNDVADVRVTLDGQPLTSRLDGKWVKVDAGEHVFRFEDAGGRSVEERIVVRQGEKGRLVSVRFPARPTAQATPSTAPSRDAAPSPGGSGGRGIPTATWIFGGVAVLGGAGFAVLWLDAVHRAKDVRDTCAPHCSTADVSGIKTEALLADISLGVGVAAALSAIGFVVFRPARSGSAGIVVNPQRGGASLDFARTW